MAFTGTGVNLPIFYDLIGRDISATKTVLASDRAIQVSGSNTMAARNRQYAAESTAAQRSYKAQAAAAERASAAQAAAARRSTLALEKQAASMKRIGQSMTRGMTVPIAAFGIASIKMASDFERAMGQIQALVGRSAKQMQVLSKGILEMAGRDDIAKGPTELGEALYYVESAGIHGADALKLVHASAKAASAGLGETQEIASVVSSVLLAYGKANITAAHATDVLVNIVKEGKLEAAEIAPVLGRLLPMASELGIKFDNLGAALAALSRPGLDASESVAYLRQSLNTFFKPTKQAADILATMNLTFGDLRKELKTGGIFQTFMHIRGALEGYIPTAKQVNTVIDQTRERLGKNASETKVNAAAMDMLKRKYGDNIETLGKLFNGLYGLTAFLSITGKSAKSNSKIFEALAHSTGLTDKAARIMAETMQNRASIAWARLQAEMIKFGGTVGPSIVKAISTIAGWITKAVGAFNSLGTTGKAVALSIGAFALAAGPIVRFASTILTMSKAVGTALTFMGNRWKFAGAASRAGAAQMAASAATVQGSIPGRGLTAAAPARYVPVRQGAVTQMQRAPTTGFGGAAMGFIPGLERGQKAATGLAGALGKIRPAGIAGAAGIAAMGAGIATNFIPGVSKSVQLAGNLVATGGALGAAFGPWGIAIGAAAGGLTGLAIAISQMESPTEKLHNELKAVQEAAAFKGLDKPIGTAFRAMAAGLTTEVRNLDVAMRAVGQQTSTSYLNAMAQLAAEQQTLTAEVTDTKFAMSGYIDALKMADGATRRLEAAQRSLRDANIDVQQADLSLKQAREDVAKATGENIRTLGQATQWLKTHKNASDEDKQAVINLMRAIADSSNAHKAQGDAVANASDKARKATDRLHHLGDAAIRGAQKLQQRGIPAMAAFRASIEDVANKADKRGIPLVEAQANAILKLTGRIKKIPPRWFSEGMFHIPRSDLNWAINHMNTLIDMHKRFPTIAFKVLVKWAQGNQPSSFTSEATSRRRGGYIFQGGGMVPVALSPQEQVVFPGGGSFIVPGSPRAADSYQTAVPAGSAVLTHTGKAMYAGGAALEDAVAMQMPHFATGGVVGRINKAIGTRPMHGTGRTFSTAANRWNDDPYLLAAIAGKETEFGRTGLGRASQGYNAFGMIGHHYGDYPAAIRGAAANLGSAKYKGKTFREQTALWVSGNKPNSSNAKYSISVASIYRSIAGHAPKADADDPVSKSKTKRWTTFSMAKDALPTRFDAYMRGFEHGLNPRDIYQGILPDVLKAINIKPTKHEKTTTTSAAADNETSTTGLTPARAKGLRSMIARASAIDRMKIDYDTSFHGSLRPDCSGSVSSVLAAAGLVSGAPTSTFYASSDWGRPGKGKHVTTWSHGPDGPRGHVFMVINGRHFGTHRSNPGGGPGWFGGTSHTGFEDRHPAGYQRGGIVDRQHRENILAQQARGVRGLKTKGKVGRMFGAKVFYPELFDPGVLGAIRQAGGDLMGRWPGVLRAIHGDVELPHGTYARTHNRVIEFSTSWIQNAKQARAHLAHDTAIGWASKGGKKLPLQHLFAHEFAHALGSRMVAKGGRLGRNFEGAMSYLFPVLGPWFDPHTAEVATQPGPNRAKASRQLAAARKFIVANVGMYARRNPSEFFAEGFAEYWSRPRGKRRIRPVPREIGVWAYQHLQRGGTAGRPKHPFTGLVGTGTKQWNVRSALARSHEAKFPAWIGDGGASNLSKPGIWRSFLDAASHNPIGGAIKAIGDAGLYAHLLGGGQTGSSFALGMLKDTATFPWTAMKRAWGLRHPLRAWNAMQRDKSMRIGMIQYGPRGGARAVLSDAEVRLGRLEGVAARRKQTGATRPGHLRPGDLGKPGTPLRRVRRMQDRFKFLEQQLGTPAWRGAPTDARRMAHDAFEQGLRGDRIITTTLGRGPGERLVGIGSWKSSPSHSGPHWEGGSFAAIGGHGRDLFRQTIRAAARNKASLEWDALPGAVPLYKSLGIPHHPFGAGGPRFELNRYEVARLAKDFYYFARSPEAYQYRKQRAAERRAARGHRLGGIVGMRRGGIAGYQGGTGNVQSTARGVARLTPGPSPFSGALGRIDTGAIGKGIGAIVDKAMRALSEQLNRMGLEAVLKLRTRLEQRIKTLGAGKTSPAIERELKRLRGALLLFDERVGEIIGSRVAAAQKFLDQAVSMAASEGLFEREMTARAALAGEEPTKTAVDVAQQRGLSLIGQKALQQQGIGALEKTLAAAKKAKAPNVADIQKQLDDAYAGLAELNVQTLENQVDYMNAVKEAAAAAEAKIDAQNQALADRASAMLALAEATGGDTGAAMQAAVTAQKAVLDTAKNRLNALLTDTIPNSLQADEIYAATTNVITAEANLANATNAASQAVMNAAIAMSDYLDKLSTLGGGPGVDIGGKGGIVTTAFSQLPKPIQDLIKSKTGGKVDAATLASWAAANAGAGGWLAKWGPQAAGFVDAAIGYNQAITTTADFAQSAAQDVSDLGDSIQQMAIDAANARISMAEHGSTMAELGFQQLELQQRLSKTYDTPAAQQARRRFILSSEIPELQRVLDSIMTALADQNIQGADRASLEEKREQARIAIMQAQLTADEQIAEATTKMADILDKNPGSLAFQLFGESVTDRLFASGVG